MKTYCAFLRGVNVNGTSMKMKDVEAVFTSVGMKNVQSVLASGNILFEGDACSIDLKSVLETALSKAFNYTAFLFIRDQDEVHALLNQRALDDREGYHNYVLISDPTTSLELLSHFDAVGNPDVEQAKIVDQVLYWQTPKGTTLQSKFSKVLGNKQLKNKLTSRNLNTLQKIINKLK